MSRKFGMHNTQGGLTGFTSPNDYSTNITMIHVPFLALSDQALRITHLNPLLSEIDRISYIELLPGLFAKDNKKTLPATYVVPGNCSWISGQWLLCFYPGLRYMVGDFILALHEFGIACCKKNLTGE